MGVLSKYRIVAYYGKGLPTTHMALFLRRCDSKGNLLSYPLPSPLEAIHTNTYFLCNPRKKATQPVTSTGNCNLVLERPCCLSFLPSISIIMNISSDNSDNNGNGGGLIALLDLPKHSRVGLDGQVIILQHEDFVGISNIPVAAATTFHLVTAAAAAAGSKTSNNQNLGMTVGFVVFDTKNPVRLIRKYNPQTEEVSHETVDDITTNNLLQQVQQGTLPPTRLLPYNQIVTTPQNVNHHWTQTTRYICSSNILQLRNLHSGDKIVPGAYQEEEQVGDATNTTTTASVQNDGKSISYPPIPVLDPTKELHKHKHAGTQRFLAKLPPPERTQLFLRQEDKQDQDLPSSSSTLLQHLLMHYYQNSYQALLGDVQLSFVLFLQLQCLHSLNHWKDLIAMLGLASSSHDCCSHHMALYQGLLQVLPYQLSAMDVGFLEEDDEAGGNFLLPSLQRLQRNLVGKLDATVMDQFQNVLQSKFPQTFSSLEDSGLRIQLLPDGGEEENDAMQDAENDIEDDDDDDDGPVMVSQDEIQAAVARSTYATPSNNSNNTIDIPRDIQEKYPLLMAAMQPHEDVVMTCARALDEQVDVSLVREAAAYLEQVEQYR